jgi:micrococcal nuclease
MQRARVVDVVDGDTFDVEIDGVEQRVRFYGIDTSERGEPCFHEATERVTTLLDAEVRLAPDARDSDRFDRLLRYVYTPTGASIDAHMVAAGLAEAWRADGAYRDGLIAIENYAKSERTGCLWR